MKRPSTPTLRQKKLIGSKRLNPHNWLVVVDKPMTKTELIFRLFLHLWWLWAGIIGLMLWEYKREEERNGRHATD
jgi:hypothetical protein